jgi:hypothetical protein
MSKVICKKDELVPIADKVREIKETEETFNTVNLSNELINSIDNVATEQTDLINEISEFLDGKGVTSALLNMTGINKGALIKVDTDNYNGFENSQISTIHFYNATESVEGLFNNSSIENIYFHFTPSEEFFTTAFIKNSSIGNLYVPWPETDFSLDILSNFNSISNIIYNWEEEIITPPEENKLDI